MLLLNVCTFFFFKDAMALVKMDNKTFSTKKIGGLLKPLTFYSVNARLYRDLAFYKYPKYVYSCKNDYKN